MEYKKKESQRNYGIDLLRLVAAFYVIILHTMLQGGLFSATASNSYQDITCRILLICSFCAVNIFGIVSGYVGYREPKRAFSFTGYISLWIDVVFYGVMITLVYMFIRPNTVTISNLINMFHPVTKKLYWYFSAYTMVYFLAPFLNRMIHHCSEKELKYLFFLICFIFVPIDFISDSFSMSPGYSGPWLILLYVLGAIMKKTSIGSKIRPITAILFIIILNTSLFFLNTKYPSITILNLNIDFAFENTHSYVSPFFLGSAILHVVIFSQIRLPSFATKLISFAAPASFAVYIVNVQQHIWTYFMHNRFVSWHESSPIGIAGRTIVFALLFVFAVVLADFFKRQLFRFLKIDMRLRKLEKVFPKDISP